MGIVSIIMAIISIIIFFFPWGTIILGTILYNLNLLKGPIYNIINNIATMQWETLIILNFIAFLFAIIGLIFGIVAKIRKKGKKATSIVGIVLSCIITCICVMSLFINSLILNANRIQQENLNKVKNSINNNKR